MGLISMPSAPRLAGGRFDIESRVGGGTVVRVEFRCWKVAAMMRRAAILIADDIHL